MVIYKKRLVKRKSLRSYKRYANVLLQARRLIYIFVYFQILKKGEVQVGEKERDHDLETLRKEIATLVAEKCVDPATQMPYPVGMIEKAMAEAGYSIKQNKNAKSQVIRRSHLG